MFQMRFNKFVVRALREASSDLETIEKQAIVLCTVPLKGVVASGYRLQKGVLIVTDTSAPSHAMADILR